MLEAEQAAGAEPEEGLEDADAPAGLGYRWALRKDSLCCTGAKLAAGAEAMMLHAGTQTAMGTMRPQTLKRPRTMRTRKRKLQLPMTSASAEPPWRCPQMLPPSPGCASLSLLGHIHWRGMRRPAHACPACRCTNAELSLHSIWPLLPGCRGGAANSDGALCGLGAAHQGRCEQAHGRHGLCAWPGPGLGTPGQPGPSKGVTRCNFPKPGIRCMLCGLHVIGLG